MPFISVSYGSTLRGNFNPFLSCETSSISSAPLGSGVIPALIALRNRLAKALAEDDVAARI